MRAASLLARLRPYRAPRPSGGPGRWPPLPPGFLGTTAALAVGQILAWAPLYYGFTSYVLPMQAELGWPGTRLMGAFTLGLAVWGAAAYGAGALVDWGHGRCLMTGGAVLAGLGFALWSQVNQPWHLLLVWALLGVAMAAILYEPAFAVLTRRFPTHYRQGITALTLVAGFASTVAFPAVAALQAALGWRGSLLALAGLLVGVVAPLNAWALRGASQGAATRQPDLAADVTLRQATRTGAFWLLALTFTAYSFAQAGFWAHVMPAFAAKGLSQAQALQVLVWVGPCQVAGRLVYASLGRHWRLKTVGVVVLSGLPVAFALFALAHSLPALAAFAFLLGASNGLVTIVRGGLVPEYFGRTHVGRIGGAISAIGLLARAGAPLSVAALLLVLPGGYEDVMLVLSAVCAIAVAAFAAARRPSWSG
ncbi:MFS transporter [Ideonella livida]|uniref:MFS transporter n=1 Tax=Ideonella livida TaxID=2707176 RepID=A0A7C9TM35_9BURK|nr:MFS transporter [Ideonella livida]NDY91386.1 MFS transporter [Ideonella livida]